MNNSDTVQSFSKDPKAAMEQDVVHTTDNRVICEGSKYTGHPRVYLDVGKNGQIQCPYCSRLFIKG